jgi:hypothetical protein
MKRAKAGFFASVAVVAAAQLLSGCSEDFSVPEKGTYTGAADEPLDPAARDRLRARARYQNYN